MHFQFLFDRSQRDDSVPELVIPLEYVSNQLESMILRSSSGKVIKGKIVIATTHSLNTVMTMDPMVVTVKMSVVGATTLLNLINQHQKRCGDILDHKKDGEVDVKFLVMKKPNLL